LNTEEEREAVEEEVGSFGGGGVAGKGCHVKSGKPFGVRGLLLTFSLLATFISKRPPPQNTPEFGSNLRSPLAHVLLPILVAKGGRRPSFVSSASAEAVESSASWRRLLLSTTPTLQRPSPLALPTEGGAVVSLLFRGGFFFQGGLLFRGGFCF